jgi:hypothetical protein
MLNATRYKLHFGPYAAPRFKYGQRVTDEARGEVEIVGLSDAKIPWPTAKLTTIVSRKAGLVIYKGLAKALRTESATAICYWWGVTAQTVSKWRNLLGVDRSSIPGETLLRKEAVHEPYFKRFRKAGLVKSGDPVRRAKIAATQRGKPRPRHVIDAMRDGRLASRNRQRHEPKYRPVINAAGQYHQLLQLGYRRGLRNRIPKDNLCVVALHFTRHFRPW